jgi:hypothetical protein
MTVTLGQPIVGSQPGHPAVVVLAGSVVEIDEHAVSKAVMDILCNAQQVSVFRQDLLDACPVLAVARLECL